MYVELRSPNIHEPASMTEYNNTIVNYRGTTPFLWAGGTEIMSEPDFYPALRGNMEIISLDRIEELHHFLRNDRYAEFGAMVSINEIAQAGKLVLPKILLDTINGTATRTVRERITIGGSLCTRRFKTALASTLMILDAAVELRYMKKRMHSKWFQISRIYDKDGRLFQDEAERLGRLRALARLGRAIATPDALAAARRADGFAATLSADYDRTCRDLLTRYRLERLAGNAAAAEAILGELIALGPADSPFWDWAQRERARTAPKEEPQP